ncbi:MAG: MFS transporter [Paludibacteraceae bacterium]|jgi:MFS family permease|nr:MFS transporter [Paludibacteraceae bacterium]
MVQDKLWSKSFVCACCGNFLLCFAFYLLLPLLPLYLIETFQTGKAEVGIILSCYTVAALAIRPFSGFILDAFNRKRVYLLTYFLFVVIFFGYTYSKLIALFVVFRILHGFIFGTVTTAGNTIVVDITPSSRRGEGLGYYGVANNLAMATGPMLALFMHDACSYNTIFYTAIAFGTLGLVFASCIKVPRKVPTVDKEPVSLDRFFLKKGLPAGFSLMFLAVPYGMTTSYVALYGQELGIAASMGLFFTIMAVGLIASRLFSGKMVDKGKIPLVINIGIVISIAAYILFTLLHWVALYNLQLCTILFFSVPAMLGVGYGMMFPAFNTLFVNLAPNNRRATASSTYLTSWDIGIGIGLVVGGRLADVGCGLWLSFGAGCISNCIAYVLFSSYAIPHFLKNKLR